MKVFFLAIAIVGIIGTALIVLPKLRGVPLEALPASVSDIEAQMGVQKVHLVSSEPEISGIFSGCTRQIYKSIPGTATQSIEEIIIVKNNKAVAYETSYDDMDGWIKDEAKIGNSATQAWHYFMNAFLRISYANATGTNARELSEDVRADLKDMTDRVCTYEYRNSNAMVEEINGLQMMCETKTDGRVVLSVMPISTFKKLEVARVHEN